MVEYRTGLRGTQTVGGDLQVDGTILASDGAEGSPGITYEADRDTGLYRIGANHHAIVAGGTQRIRFDASFTGIIVPSGTDPAFEIYEDGNKANPFLSLETAGSFTNAITNQLWILDPDNPTSFGGFSHVALQIASRDANNSQRITLENDNDNNISLSNVSQDLLVEGGVRVTTGKAIQDTVPNNHVVLAAGPETQFPQTVKFTGITGTPTMSGHTHAEGGMTAVQAVGGDVIGTGELDLSIAPTWTGSHTHSADMTFDDDVSLLFGDTALSMSFDSANSRLRILDVTALSDMVRFNDGGRTEFVNRDVELNGVQIVNSAGTQLLNNSPSSAYTLTDFTTDRTLDAQNDSVNQVADVLGTLINDLQTHGLIG